IFSEGTTTDGSQGALVGSTSGCFVYTKDITFHHNLFANNFQRNPKINHDTGRNEIINNVIYNWNWMGIQTNAPSYIAKNVLIAGPSTSITPKGIDVRQGSSCQSMLKPGTVMVTHNIGPGRPVDDATDDWAVTVQGPTSEWRTNSPPFTLWGMTEEDVSTVKNTVLNNAGATAPYRDSVDVRIINGVTNKTGSIINSPNDVGGWPTIASGSYPTDTDGDGMPDSWETARGLIPNDPSDWNKDRDGDGYLNIEEYINSFFSAVASPLPPPSVLIPNPPSIIGVN
ncbi:MAG: hypothetical protein ACYTKD_32440, partial [Planctomycetota bacterium]